MEADAFKEHQHSQRTPFVHCSVTFDSVVGLRAPPLQHSLSRINSGVRCVVARHCPCALPRLDLLACRPQTSSDDRPRTGRAGVDVAYR